MCGAVRLRELQRHSRVGKKLWCAFGDESLVKLLLEKGADGKAKNSKGETALDIVSKEWDSQLETTYQGVGRSLNRKFDLRQLKTVRPQIASLLEKNASVTTNDGGPAK